MARCGDVRCGIVVFGLAAMVRWCGEGCVMVWYGSYGIVRCYSVGCGLAA